MNLQRTYTGSARYHLVRTTLHNKLSHLWEQSRDTSQALFFVLTKGLSILLRKTSDPDIQDLLVLDFKYQLDEPGSVEPISRALAGASL